ncbi:predicted protein [Arabidopsis lyrata subsp. lyrata]|uniref:Predicted protein n=1 Tax=Arabidopsis lyrata subsp. lyrata TaxID=81972 RepID=D7LJX3_ARALL|nr:predicted protein [Arabidopsis lyrata subsp. lyrata]
MDNHTNSPRSHIGKTNIPCIARLEPAEKLSMEEKIDWRSFLWQRRGGLQCDIAGKSLAIIFAGEIAFAS